VGVALDDVGQPAKNAAPWSDAEDLAGAAAEACRRRTALGITVATR
jgi:hypothetical protein